VVILNAVKDPCISSLLLPLPVFKFVSSVQIRVRPFAFEQKSSTPNALKSNHMITDLEYSYSPVRDKVRALREYL
jgi:hypothetical protein